MPRRGCSGDDKNSGADDGANPKRNQIAGTEGALQAMFASFLGFVKYDRDRLGRQQSTHQSSSKCHCEFERAASRSRPFYFRPGTTRSVRHGPGLFS